MGCQDSKSALTSTSTQAYLRVPCTMGMECASRTDYGHNVRFCHPGETDFPIRSNCPFGDDCPQINVEVHIVVHSHPGDADYGGPRKACKNRSDCPDFGPRHRRRFSHPGCADYLAALPRGEGSDETRAGTATKPSDQIVIPIGEKRKACRFGLRCFRRNDEHIFGYSHPGDRDYRHGLVIFDDKVKPEFGTARQLFDFFDPLGHGYFTQKQDLAAAIGFLADYLQPSLLGDGEGGGEGKTPFAPDLNPDSVWAHLGGNDHKFVGFAKFAFWAQQVGSALPIGVETGNPDETYANKMVCNFVFPDGGRCSCKVWKPEMKEEESEKDTDSEAAKGRVSTMEFCTCGHKRSMHAEVNEGAATRPRHWPGISEGQLGLVQLGGDVVARFQALFDETHKVTDNWTRDRGCAMHGLSCRTTDPGCVFRSKCEVPTGYRVADVMLNVNPALWEQFSVIRGAITKECSERTRDGQAFKAITDLRTDGLLTTDCPTSEGCNEWIMFHGSTPDKCRDICNNNFRLSLAGSGATWKKPDGGRACPLYGHGVYFAERITKADEYSDMVKAGSRCAGCHTVVVSRVVGGRAQYCDTNEIDTSFLQKQVIAGPYHSVLGDRVTKLKKPYKEIVVYDAMQCYPEFLVYYRRLYG